MVTKFGDTLVQHIPAEFTQFLKKLCTNYYPSNTLLLDQVCFVSNMYKSCFKYFETIIKEIIFMYIIFITLFLLIYN